MFADSLLAAERGHLARLLVWAIGSCVAGLVVLIVARRSHGDTALLKHFGIQTAAWGAVDLLIVVVARSGLALRNYDAMVRLDRFLWFNTGLDVGYVAVGVTLALCGWRIGKRGLLGAGLAIVAQGVALALLDLRLAMEIGPAR
jgi:hypothetical protein